MIKNYHPLWKVQTTHNVHKSFNWGSFKLAIPFQNSKFPFKVLLISKQKDIKQFFVLFFYFFHHFPHPEHRVPASSKPRKVTKKKYFMEISLSLFSTPLTLSVWHDSRNDILRDVSTAYLNIIFMELSWGRAEN